MRTGPDLEAAHRTQVPVENAEIEVDNNLTVPATSAASNDHRASPAAYRKSRRAQEVGGWAEAVVMRHINERLTGCTNCIHRAANGETPGWDIDYNDENGVLQRIEVKGTAARQSG